MIKRADRLARLAQLLAFEQELIAERIAKRDADYRAQQHKRRAADAAALIEATKRKQTKC